MTANCPNCGGVISATAKFCRHCRYDLRASSFPLPPSPSPLTSQSDDFDESDEIQPRRRSLKVLLIVGLVLVLVVFCILVGLSFRKALQGRTSDPVSQSPTIESGPATAQPVIPVMVVPTAIPQGQPVTVVPVLPPTASSPSLPASQYDIVVASGSGEHPDGVLAYGSASTCGGGCGSFKGTVGLRGIRVVDNSNFVVDVDISITEISGDPWLFQGDLGDIRFEINGQAYKAVSSSFPSQVTGPTALSGYLTFGGQIPLADPANPQYQVLLLIPSRLAQPIEGWLAPHQ